jgi:hypothetical protein
MEPKNYKALKDYALFANFRFVIGLIFISLFTFTLTNSSYGQLNRFLNNMNPNTNFYTIKNRMDVYIDSLKTTMDSASYYSGVGEFKEYKKFLKYWEPRVSGNGIFENYFESEYNYFTSGKEDFHYITEIPWRELGPKEVYAGNTSTWKGIGPVEFISFFDNGTASSTQYMLTGSLMGGPFFSSDFGNSWKAAGNGTWI